MNKTPPSKHLGHLVSSLGVLKKPLLVYLAVPSWHSYSTNSRAGSSSKNRPLLQAYLEEIDIWYARIIEYILYESMKRIWFFKVKLKRSKSYIFYKYFIKVLMNAPSFQISMRGIEPNLATPPKGITSPCQSRITRFVPPGGIGGLKQETQSHSYNKSVRLFNSFMPIKSQIKLIDLNR